MDNEKVPPAEAPPKPPLDFLSEAVEREFKVHHIEGDRFRLAYFTRATASGEPVKSDSPAVDDAFDRLRVAIKRYSYVATLQLVGQDGIVTVSRVVDPEFRSARVNWIFFVLTVLSVQAAGALLWASYVSPHGPTGREPGVDWLSGEAMGGGFVFFAMPLLAVLGLHEMGHFFTARRYHVRASLPFFIPSLPPLGTFGAFISMRDPLPSRKVIFDIGLSGPLVGFVASIGVTVVGALLMQAHPSPPRPEFGGSVNLGSPLMFDVLLRAMNAPADSYLHPTLFAGWAGFLVTAFNLIPAAQLDGGHVFFSLIRNGPNREQRAIGVSIASVLGIAVLGSMLGYNGWLLLILIVFLTIRHPPPLNQISALGMKRFLAGLGAIAVFAVSFAPAPIQIVYTDFSFDVESSPAVLEVHAGGLANTSFVLINEGNTYNELRVELKGVAGGFTASFGGSNTSTTVLTNKLEFEEVEVNVTVASLGRTAGETGALQFLVTALGEPGLTKVFVVNAVTVRSHPSLNASAAVPANVTAGSVVEVPILVTNTGDVPLRLALNVSVNFTSWAWGLGSLGTYNATAEVAPGENASVGFFVSVPGNATAGTNATYIIQVEDPTWPSVGVGLAVEIRVE